MDKPERRGWPVIATFLIVQLTVFGPSIATVGVFITPLIKQFGWSHAQVSRIATAWALSYGLSCPIVGWMLERINARWLVATGCTMCGLGFLTASRIHALLPLEICYAVIGIGIAMSADVPLMVVAVNWFKERSALAIGVGATGRSIGLTTSPALVTWMVVHYGWRMGMAAMAMPMLLIGLPASLLMIRNPPEREHAASIMSQPADLPGLDLSTAFSTSTFWLIILAFLAFSLGTSGIVIHLIPYFISLSYTPQQAALIFGAQAALAGLGHIVIGAAADRYGAKRIQVMSFSLIAIAIVLLTLAGNPRFGTLAIIAFVPLWGFDFGSDTLLSVVMVQTLGRRRYGTLTGLLNFTGAFGHSIGPILIGALFDVTGAYHTALMICAVLTACGALAGGLIFPAKGHDRVPLAASLAVS
jgi:MFS family permease